KAAKLSHSLTGRGRRNLLLPRLCCSQTADRVHTCCLMPRGPSSCGMASPFSMGAPRSWNGWLVSPLGHTSDFINDRCCRPSASVPPSGLASITLAEYLCDQNTWPKLTVI
uniref:Uncharacterized protein n=1 Tax=Mus spicilegus TaxID=10103 RepID=A0A8C6HBR0_MUSSI